jgi:hypothetical protein
VSPPLQMRLFAGGRKDAPEGRFLVRRPASTNSCTSSRHPAPVTGVAPGEAQVGYAGLLAAAGPSQILPVGVHKGGRVLTTDV